MDWSRRGLLHAAAVLVGGAAVWQEAERADDPVERALLCCADSRVAPEWIFASGSGELFEERAAGNTAFNEGIASLEYAVAELAVPLILVMGHSGCGAVGAALANQPLTPLLEELVTLIRAVLKPGDDLSRAIRAIRANAAASGRVSVL